MATQINVNFGTIDGRSAQLQFSGDLGRVWAPGAVIRLTGENHLVCRTAIYDLSSTNSAVTFDAPLRPTVQQAANFAGNVQTALVAAGLTFLGQV